MCLCLLLGGGSFEKKKFFGWGEGRGLPLVSAMMVVCHLGLRMMDGVVILYMFLKWGFDGIAWGGWVMGFGIVQHMFWNGA